VAEIPIISPPHAVATIILTNEARVVVFQTFPISQIGPFAKFVKSHDMWLYSVITVLITRINMTTLLRYRLFLPLLNKT
jgi:hypothetical protein